jgi:hypothetical protein
MFGLNSFKVRRFGYKLHCLLLARNAWFVDNRGDVHHIKVFKREGSVIKAHFGTGFMYAGFQTMSRYSVFYKYEHAMKRSLLEQNDLLTNENLKLKQLLARHEQNKTVYVVTTDYGYDHNDFHSVWSTKELAEERCRKINKDVGASEKNPVADWVDIEIDNP